MAADDRDAAVPPALGVDADIDFQGPHQQGSAFGFDMHEQLHINVTARDRVSLSADVVAARTSWRGATRCVFGTRRTPSLQQAARAGKLALRSVELAHRIEVTGPLTGHRWQSPQSPGLTRSHRLTRRCRYHDDLPPSHTVLAVMATASRHAAPTR